MIILKGGQGFNNVYTVSGEDLSIISTNLKVQGRQLERGKILQRHLGFLYVRNLDNQIRVLKQINNQLDTQSLAIEPIKDIIIDFSPFSTQTHPQNLIVMTIKGKFFLYEIDPAVNRATKKSENYLKLFPNELCSSIEVNSKFQFIAVSTFTDARYLSRLVIMEIKAGLSNIKEIDCVSFINTQPSFKVGSFFRTLNFANSYKGCPMILAFQHSGEKKVYSYYIKNAKAYELENPHKISSGCVLDYGQFDRQVCCIDDAGTIGCIYIV